MSSQILLVDDDHQLCDLLRDYLTRYGYRVLVAHNSFDMSRRMREANIDLIILDVMLPGQDGITLCRKIREKSSVSIIMLSALGEEADRVVGLEVGADDYLTKPFSPRELLARVKALLRRTHGDLGEDRKKTQLANLPTLKFLNWSLDQKKRRLIDPEGVAVPLSAGEYELLLAFMSHPQRTLTRDQLMDITRGHSANPLDRSIDVQVGRLRKKIEADAKNPSIIVTVRGDGYLFTADVFQE